MAQRVLVVDDEAAIRDTLRMVLEYEGYDVSTVGDGRAAIEALEESPVAAILLDIKMPGLDGLETLDRIVAREGAPPVLMISGHGDIATAIECTRRGAVDFLEKPLQRERVLVSVRNALSGNRLRAENQELKRRVDEESVLLGDSEPMRRLRAEVARAAPTAATVLILGESGTGKELVAREIHRASRVASGPFVQVNCAAIPEELIESELFGHEKGSFTGAVRKQIGKFVEADGGTIFLDEVGDMSARAQAKVLRVLEVGRSRARRRRKIGPRGRARDCGDQPRPFRRDPLRPVSRRSLLPPECRPPDHAARCGSAPETFPRWCSTSPASFPSGTTASRAASRRARSVCWPRARGPATCGS